MVALGRPADRPGLYRRALLGRRSRACALPTSPSSPSPCSCGRRRPSTARAFYAAGNTFVPMVAGTVVTVVSLPIYASLYHWLGAMGLAVASDIGIALQTADHRCAAAQAAHGFLASLDYAEMGRCLLGVVCGRRRRVARRVGPARRPRSPAAHGPASATRYYARRDDPHRRASPLASHRKVGFLKNPARRCPAWPAPAAAGLSPPHSARTFCIAQAHPGAPQPQSAAKNTSAPHDAEALVLMRNS